MKQILFIYGQLNGGGAERVLIDILRNFDYTRYKVDLCLTIAGGTLIDEIPQEVSIISLWSTYTLEYKIVNRLSKYLGFHFPIKRKLKKCLPKKYDVEISFLEGTPLRFHYLKSSSAKKISWVHCDLYNFHYTENQFRKNEELKAYNAMDHIIGVSNDCIAAFRRRFPNCNTDLEVIYNPVDIKKVLKLANKDSISKEKFTIVTVGRLTPPKKMDRIIRIAKRFKDIGYDLNFRIVGDGELREDLMFLRGELGVEDIVELVGFHRNPFSYIKHTDMMFCCSGFEGFCLAICEAMCLGIPVVSTKTAGPIEIIENNKYGLLCNHDDDAMFDAVKKMVDDSELRKYYSQKGIERVDCFAIQNTMYSLYQLIEGHILDAKKIIINEEENIIYHK